ncbi:MAG: serine protease [Patescibacteria group bacterium]
MELYYILGRGLVSIFVSITSLLSPSSIILPPVSLPVTEVPQAITPSVTGSTSIPLPTQISDILPISKTISIYLNYPEKVTIAPVKSININFKKIFQYSLDVSTTTPIALPQKNISPVTIPTLSSITHEQKIKNSVVNIYCSIQNGKNVKVITGSGIVVDPQGIVLTNAHVGQFPLLQNNPISSNMSCSIRTGSPINKTYGVKTLYISKDWIFTNYKNISQTNFSETGEGDIAILQIVDKLTGASAGKIFDYLSLASSAPTINDQISIASYPADILGTSGINSLLTVQTEKLRISDSFSFSYAPLPDLLETSDSLQAQHGSSGGALLNNSDALAGLITITVSGNSPLMKHVRALTIHHISNVIQKDTGYSLSSFLDQDIDNLFNQFELTQPVLVQRLIDGSASLFFQQ